MPPLGSDSFGIIRLPARHEIIPMNRFARFVPLVSLVLAQMAASASVATTATAQLRAPNATPTPVGALTRAKPAVVGMSNTLEARVDAVINAAIKDHATPGAPIPHVATLPCS